MDMDKCCVVVIASKDSVPPDAMTPQTVHALVRAREAHVRYRSYLGTLLVQMFVAALFVGFTNKANPANLVLGILGASMSGAALHGLIARAWRRRFEKMAAG